MTNSRDVMIVKTLEGRHIHVCAGRKCETNPDAVITEYYSETHARDDGWRKTDDIKFCQRDRDYAWVCPECWKKT